MNRFLFASLLGACALPMFAPPRARAATAGAVTLSIGDARLVEPPAGQKSMIFPVTLSGARSEDVRFSYSTSVGPNVGTVGADTLAQPGFDFSTRQGELVIPAGTTRTQIEVPILADTQIEKDETFTVTMLDVSSSDNSGNTVRLVRSVAKGTIIEPVKGIALGGKVLSYSVTPYQSFDSSGQPSDDFDAPAKLVPQSGVSVTATLVSTSGQTLTRTTTTDALGNYSLLVLPGTYSVQVEPFSRPDFDGNGQTFATPARTVSLSRDSRANTFTFYGVAGTVGVPSFSNSRQIFGAYVQVEARLVGDDPNSAPIATAIAEYFDTVKVSRGYRFSMSGLPQGRYTLSIKDVGQNAFYTVYYTFPTLTVSVPDTSSVNRPSAHVAILGKIKSFNRARKSPSAPSS